MADTKDLPPLPDGVIPDGSPLGAATVYWNRRNLGHYNAQHEFIPQELPDGYKYGPKGVLEPLDEKVLEQELDANTTTIAEAQAAAAKEA